MKGMLRFKFWLIALIVVIVFGFFNFQAIADFFMGNRDPNERISRSLRWKSATGEERHAMFSIPKGYYTPGAHNKEGEAITLDVMYPTKAFVPWKGAKGPNPSEVHILIERAGRVGPERTVGDRYKAALDAGTLATSVYHELVGRQDKTLVLRMIGRDVDKREVYLFHDPARGHWISSVPKQETFRAAEAFLKDQTASVFYSYRQALEPNPVIMHQWVMEFVESVQSNNQPTQSKDK